MFHHLVNKANLKETNYLFIQESNNHVHSREEIKYRHLFLHEANKLLDYIKQRDHKFIYYQDHMMLAAKQILCIKEIGVEAK
jgi:hypothetical protein